MKAGRIARIAAAVSVGIAFVAATALPSFAETAAPRTVRVSVSSTGEQAAKAAGLVAFPRLSDGGVSDGGRFTVFTSSSPNLVPDDTNETPDVFLHDAVNRTTTRVNVAGDGTQADATSLRPSITADGRYVAFASRATNLVAGDTNAVSDVFVRDMVTGTTTMVSVTKAGRGGDAPSGSPIISADGRHVTFTSSATNLVAGDSNGQTDVFVRDLVAGTTTRVNLTSSQKQVNDEVGFFDGDFSQVVAGRYVAFISRSQFLVAGDTNDTFDVFVRDLVAGTTVRASVSSDGVQADTAVLKESVSITADGRSVTFESQATTLVDGDTGFDTDVFRRDLTDGTTTLIELDPYGTLSPGDTFNSQISADGGRVLFHPSVFGALLQVQDLATGVTTDVDVSAFDARGNGDTYAATFSPDGRFVAFASRVRGLVAGDTNDFADVFVRELD